MLNNGKCYILILLLLSINPLLAQPVLKGIVVGRDNSPIENAALRLFRIPDSSLVAGTMSGINGLFSFSGIKSGLYVLKASFAGYKGYIGNPVELNTGYLGKKLDTIYLEVQAVSLRSVSVSGSRSLFTIQQDRMVLNVENSIASAGGMALDLIATIPGITVNYQEGSISMNGKKGVVVMINGKPNYMSAGEVVKMLQGLGSGNIKKIEFISTPPSSFDAEGNAGFINIILKRNSTDGLNGSFSLMSGYGKGFLSSGSGNFNYRANRINLYGDFGYSQVQNKPFTTFYRRVSNRGVVKENYSTTDRQARIPNITGRLGFDIELSRKTTTGIMVSAYDNQFHLHAINTALISSIGSIDTTISISNREVNHWKNYSVNFNIQHTLDNKSLLTFNADYIYYKNSDPVSYTNTYFNGTSARLYDEEIETSKITPINFKVVSIDFSRKLDSATVINIGAKATVLRFSNDVGFFRMGQNVWQKDSALSSIHSLQEDYSAAYVSLAAKPSERIDLRLGLRYEYTNSNLSSQTKKDIVDRHYGNLFPSVLVSYKLADNLIWSASYNRRITRPTFNDMAPFTYYQDPNTFLSGNPALQPSLSSTVKTDLQFRKYFLSVSYTFEKGSIQMYQPTIDSVANKLFFSSENITNLKTFSAFLAIPFNPRNWLSCTYTFGFIQQEANLIYSGSPVRRSHSILSVNGVQRATFGKDWSLELSGFFRTGDIVGIFIQKPYGSLDMGLRKQLGAKGAIVLSLSNAFNSMKFRFLAEEASKNLYSTIDADLLYRAIKLTYTLPFGSQKVKGKRNRNTGTEDEKNRVN